MPTLRPDDLTPILRGQEETRPRLTWYAPGERIELSGRVLHTWVSKAADLLVEELDVAPGTRVVLDVPVHWRACVWALAAWTVGATVVCADDRDGDEPPDDDVLVVEATRLPTAASRRSDPSRVVALTLAALARRASVELPPGVIDEAAVLSTYADVMTPPDRAEADSPALLAPGGAWTYATVLPPADAGRRHLSGRGDLADVLRQAAGAWAAGGSIVLVDAAWESSCSADELAAVLASEGVDQRA